MKRAAVLLLVLFLAACGSSGSRSVKNGPIIVSSGTMPEAGISLRKPDGSFTKLTNNRLDAYPTWSPDGTQIAFVRGSAKGTHLFLMRRDGSDVHQVGDVAADATGVSWSPDGDQIAFSTRTGISVVKTDGTAVKKLTGAGTEPAWSPDGKTIVFRRPPTLYAVKADGSDVHTFLKAKGGSAFVRIFASPTWSRDGKQLALVRIDLGAAFDTPQGAIEIVNADGTGERTVARIYTDRGFDVRPAWSPEGDSVAYSDFHSEGAGGVWVVPSQGGKPRLVIDGFVYTLPSWGPAGT